MQSIALKPCPFCGGKPQWYKIFIDMKQTPVYALQCMEPACAIAPVTELLSTPAEAAEAWNRRKESRP